MAGRRATALATRRDVIRLVGAAGTAILSPWRASAAALQGPPAQTAMDLDHLMWGVPDLDAGIALLEAKTGVRAVVGGVHPKRGTRNALLSLGTGQYLEILATDPAQKGVREGRVAQLERLAAPRMFTWAAATRDIEGLERKVRAAGIETSGVVAGARSKPDGNVLRWKTFSVGGHDGDVVPFVIEWDRASRHPSLDSPGGCALRELRLEHPDPATVNRLLEALGLRVRASRGPRPGIAALLSTPKGDLLLT